MSDVSRYQGCLIGQCLGDALGFPVEGHEPDSCKKYVLEFINQKPEKMLGRAHFPFGQYSDDSQLARELIQSYLEFNGKFNPENYAKRIATIFEENRIVGRGLATQKAAHNILEGISWKESGVPPPTAGNGSAMRVAPIGLFYYDRDDLLVKNAIDQGIITHTDPRCKAGSVAIAKAVAIVLREENLRVGKFLTSVSISVEQINSTLSKGVKNLNEWINFDPSKAYDLISSFGQDSGYKAPYTWEGISPYVIPSVLWSLYSFLKSPDNYLDTISTSIAVGGDVDTTAAMAGAISGAYLGIEAIPNHLSNRLTDQGTWGYAELLDLASQCHRIKHRNY